MYSSMAFYAWSTSELIFCCYAHNNNLLHWGRYTYNNSMCTRRYMSVFNLIIVPTRAVRRFSCAGVTSWKIITHQSNTLCAISCFLDNFVKRRVSVCKQLLTYNKPSTSFSLPAPPYSTNIIFSWLTFIENTHPQFSLFFNSVWFLLHDSTNVNLLQVVQQTSRNQLL
jgi:hypothetical protein